MELEIEDGKIKAVQHNSCKRGIEYAEQEFYDPRRMVTATVAISKGVVNRVPVRTSEPIPLKYINDVLQAIYELNLFAPLDIGTVVIKNFADTDIDVVTTRSVQRAL